MAIVYFEYYYRKLIIQYSEIIVLLIYKNIYKNPSNLTGGIILKMIASKTCQWKKKYFKYKIIHLYVENIWMIIMSENSDINFHFG